jgi:hypothetical protein
VRFPTVASFVPHGALVCQAAYQTLCSGQRNVTGPVTVSDDAEVRLMSSARKVART